MNQHAPSIAVSQASLFESSPVAEAVLALSNAGVEQRGAVFTRREVVEFILDLSGYTADRNLHELRLLEPAFGNGDFLLVAIERLLTAWDRSGRLGGPAALTNCIRAVELHRSTFAETRGQVLALLASHGISARPAQELVAAWLLYGDFLLAELPGSFDVVVGNPPYVRQELIPDVLMTEYRARYKTIFDRADLYVPFVERSLLALNDGGALGFICADRWMKNRYGAPLRRLVATQFRLSVYVDMVDTDAFHSDVIAYPAITIIKREATGPTRIARRPQIDKEHLRILKNALLSPELPPAESQVREVNGIASESEPWIIDSSDELALVRRLERELPTLEEAGCKVGIGVATGADQAFIAAFDQLDVEPDRKLPLVMTRDILTGEVGWRGYGVINPFDDNGRLVDLNRYPRLKRYLEARKGAIAKRHVAQKMPANWYRTIDRIYPEIADKKKLLIPDIKGTAHIVYEDGQLYPHHNLYFITSDTWDLRALQAVLMSGIARLFVSAYSTKMHGGFLRFQAQYLRRIRVPHWQDVPKKDRTALIKAATAGDVKACNRAVAKLYRLTDEEAVALGGSD